MGDSGLLHSFSKTAKGFCKHTLGIRLDKNALSSFVRDKNKKRKTTILIIDNANKD